MKNQNMCDVTHDPTIPLPCHKLSHILRLLPPKKHDILDVLYGRPLISDYPFILGMELLSTATMEWNLIYKISHYIFFP